MTPTPALRWGHEALSRLYDEALGFAKPLPGVNIPRTEVWQRPRGPRKGGEQAQEAPGVVQACSPTPQERPNDKPGPW